MHVVSSVHLRLWIDAATLRSAAGESSSFWSFVKPLRLSSQLVDSFQDPSLGGTSYEDNDKYLTPYQTACIQACRLT